MCVCVCVWYCSPVEQQTKTRSLKQLCPWWWIGVAATTHDSTNINLPPPTGQWHALASLLGSGCRADWGQKVVLDFLAQSGPPNYQTIKIKLISVIKAVFSASLLQSSVSHDPSKIILICWFAAQETFIIINVENCCAASYFCGKCDTIQSWVRLKNINGYFSSTMLL